MEALKREQPAERLPVYVEDLVKQHRLRETYQHTLNVMCQRFTHFDHRTASFTGINAGNTLAQACWPLMKPIAALRKLDRHLRKLEQIGAAICVKRGGIIGGIPHVNVYVLPGSDAFMLKATRRGHRQAPDLDGIYRPQHLGPNEQGGLWSEDPAAAVRQNTASAVRQNGRSCTSKHPAAVRQKPPENDVPNQYKEYGVLKTPRLGVSTKQGREPEEDHRPATMARFSVADLRRPERLLQLFDGAVDAKLVEGSTDAMVQFFGLAQYCLRKAATNPCGMFVANVRAKRFHFQTDADEKRGHQLMKLAMDWGRS